MKKIIYMLLAMLMVACGVECSAQTVSGNKDGHDYVDLGLSSGRLWATCNVGASKPTEYGDYFAWGETTPKEKYSLEAYKWYDSIIGMTKYCLDCKLGTVDNLTTLLTEDDAATVNWDAGWRMPTYEELKELIDGCNWKRTDDFNGSGIAGSIGTSKANGNTVFLPGAGRHEDIYNYYVDSCNGYGFYWSSSLFEYSWGAWGFSFAPNPYWESADRFSGRSVRAVVK